MEEEIDGNRYFVKGTPQEVAAHEKIVGLQIRAATTRLAVPYAASVAFAVIAALLIAFAPESRSVAAYIGAAALLLLAAGIAGFTRFFAKAPGFQIGADRGDLNSN